MLRSLIFFALAALLLISSLSESNARIVSLEDLPPNIEILKMKVPPLNKSRTNSRTEIKKAQHFKNTVAADSRPKAMTNKV
jgi:hypothetical protein